MTSRQKAKGYRFEKFLETHLVENGIDARRRGQANQEDLYLTNLGTMEAKCWKQGIKTLYNLLGENRFLAIKWQSPQAKGKDVLVTMRLQDFISLVKGANHESIQENHAAERGKRAADPTGIQGQELLQS